MSTNFIFSRFNLNFRKHVVCRSNIVQKFQRKRKHCTFISTCSFRHLMNTTQMGIHPYVEKNVWIKTFHQRENVKSLLTCQTNGLTANSRAAYTHTHSNKKSHSDQHRWATTIIINSNTKNIWAKNSNKPSAEANRNHILRLREKEKKYAWNAP